MFGDEPELGGTDDSLRKRIGIADARIRLSGAKGPQRSDNNGSARWLAWTERDRGAHVTHSTFNHKDTETQRKAGSLCVSVSLWLITKCLFREQGGALRGIQ